MKKLKKNKIFENMGLKMLALIVAFALWFVVMNLQDSIITRTISNIEVNMRNGDVINESGYLYNITNGEKVSVLVKGPRSIVENLDEENFTAVADLSQLSVTNSTTISVSTNYTVSATNAAKLTITPINNYVTLSVEEENEKSVPVKVITKGAVKEGYQLGNPVPTPNMITVTGPESVLDSIVEVRAVVDVNGAESEISEYVSVGCIDAYGSAVEKDNISLSDSEVSVGIPVYNTKEIPIEVSTIGNVASGYGIRTVNFEPSTVIISGDEEVLKTVESVNINDVVVSEAKENIEKNVNIDEYLPEGVFVADNSDSEVAVNVSVEETSEREVVMAAANIIIDGRSGAYDYTIPSAGVTKVKVVGFEEDLEDVTIEKLSPHVDVKDKENGEYALLVTFTDGDNYRVSGTYSVVVKIEEKGVGTSNSSTSGATTEE
ncbi:MAG: hypothetical protein K6E10_12810 [Eubacterium sp.]|nr:hypothetical protein [Eubacterium sp.]